MTHKCPALTISNNYFDILLPPETDRYTKKLNMEAKNDAQILHQNKLPHYVTWGQLQWHLPLFARVSS